MKRIVVLLAAALALGAAPAAPPPSPGPGEAVVWYLGHCGFAVRTQRHLLVFDYQERRDGQIPRVRPARRALDDGWVTAEEIRGAKVRVFVSHSHNDHYDPVILEWQRTVPDIQYFFGWDVPGDTALHRLVGPRAGWDADGLEIATANSSHSGVPEVAWLIRVDGLVLFHGGDCQVDHEREFPRLQAWAPRVDLAFVTRVHEEQWHYGRQNAEFLRRFRPRAVFPMHDSAGAAGYHEAARAWRSRDATLPVFVPERLGERFVYRNRTLSRAAGPAR